MGQFLSVGICTNFSIKKETIPIEELETTLASEYDFSLYDRLELEKHWSWELKEEVFSPAFVVFIEKQLAMYEVDGAEECKVLMEELRGCKTKKDFIELAKDKQYERFQWDRYGEPDTYRLDFGRSIRINYDCIMLFAAGKINIEMNGGLFNFFAKNIAAANAEYAAAKAIKVYITG